MSKTDFGALAWWHFSKNELEIFANMLKQDFSKDVSFWAGQHLYFKFFPLDRLWSKFKRGAGKVGSQLVYSYGNDENHVQHENSFMNASLLYVFSEL